MYNKRSSFILIQNQNIRLLVCKANLIDIVYKFSLTDCLSFRVVLATPLFTSNIFGGSNIMKSNFTPLLTLHFWCIPSYTTSNIT